MEKKQPELDLAALSMGLMLAAWPIIIIIGLIAAALGGKE